MIFMRSLSIVVTSQIKLIPTPSWLVYFVLKAQPIFINFGCLWTKYTNTLAYRWQVPDVRQSLSRAWRPRRSPGRRCWQAKGEPRRPEIRKRWTSLRTSFWRRCRCWSCCCCCCCCCASSWCRWCWSGDKVSKPFLHRFLRRHKIS